MNRIPEEARHKIIDSLVLEKIHWAGGLDEIKFLEKVFPLDELPSHDPRLQNARGDIFQHRKDFCDWEDDWIFEDERFDLIECPDSVFFNFLCRTLHPRTERGKEEYETMLASYNSVLAEYNFGITPKAEAKHPERIYYTFTETDAVASLNSQQQ